MELGILGAMLVLMIVAFVLSGLEWGNKALWSIIKIGFYIGFVILFGIGLSFWFGV